MGPGRSSHVTLTPAGTLRSRLSGWVRRSPAGPGPGSHPPPTRRLGEWLDLPVGDVAALGDAVGRIYDGELDGMTIRGVFSEAEMSTAVLRARRHGAEHRDHGEQIMFGTALVGADDDRDAYYADAAAFERRLDEMFDGTFADRVEGVLSAIAGGRPATVPREEGRGRYVPATVRFLPPGRGVMHAHTANEFCDVWGAYGHLREVARMWDSLSYFVIGEAPEVGGALELYDLMWDDTPEDIRDLAMSGDRDRLLERFPVRSVTPGVGDMIVFTGGRIWHRVAPVTGASERVTVGGFLALSADDRVVYYWS